jgi:hypothetical protein
MAFNIKDNMKKNKGRWIFVGLGLLVALLLGLLVSPFASKSPDGLDKTAESKGFAKAAEEAKPAWDHAPLKDYSVSGVKSEKASTGLSGLIGVLITLAAAVLLGLAIYGAGRLRGRKDDPDTGAPLSEA